MKLIYRHFSALLIMLAAALAAVPAGAAPQVSLSVSLDSVYVLMGKATPLHIKLVAPEDAKGNIVIPSDSMCGRVEILSMADADTASAGNGRVEITRELLLQSFDSGAYLLKPVLYIDGHDTVASKRLALKVVPAMVDSLANIHDFADVKDVRRKFVDYLPDFLVDYGLWILALAALAAAGWYAWKRYFSGRPVSEVRKAKPVPPYELAVRELNALRESRLCEQGREKEYYTRLTDILRSYLQGRFGIYAMEMTSSEIRRSLAATEGTKADRHLVDQVLEIADFVKFARLRPMPSDNVRAFNSAMQFVDNTKPAPEPAPDGENGKEDEEAGANKPQTTDK